MILNIVIHPNKILRQKSKELTTDQINSPEIQKLIKNMINTMKEKQGIGLAAPQIGKNIRLIVIHTDDGSLVLINPKIIKKSFRKEVDEEGCLSLPDVFGKVKRHKAIKVKALSYKAEPIEFDAKGLFARVIQHEVDHLDGTLFIDKALKIKGKIEKEENL